MIVQIYEIQTPAEAEIMISLGVDHIGSVITREQDWNHPVIRETLKVVRSSSAKSSLIPLYNTPDTVLRTLDFHQPDIVHFCEALVDRADVRSHCGRLIELQQGVRRRFPHIRIMRSIPIEPPGEEGRFPAGELCAVFEPHSDYFLTDTVLASRSEDVDGSQPVRGFVGITGQTCNWDTAAALVAASRIPVILAGGVSPANVAEGVRRVRPAGVDSCTLTNALDEKGRPIRFRKDPQKVKALIDAVRAVEGR